MKRILIAMIVMLGVMTSCDKEVEMGPGSGNGYCPIGAYNMEVGVPAGTTFGSMDFYQNADGLIFPLDIPGEQGSYVVFIKQAKLYPDTNPDHITHGPGSLIQLPQSEWGNKAAGKGVYEDGAYVWYSPDHNIRKDRTYKITLYTKDNWNGSNTVTGEIN